MTKDAFKSVTSVKFSKNYTKLVEEIKKDPIELFMRNKYFTDFNPTPAQTVVLKCMLGQLLDDEETHEILAESLTEEKGEDGEMHEVFSLEPEYLTEVELYTKMTGKEYVPSDQTPKNRINLIVGRRGGKTTLSAVIALYLATMVNWKPMLKKAPVATIAILSHSRELSEEVLETIRQFADESKIISLMIDPGKRDAKSSFNLRVPWWCEKENKRIFSNVRILVGTASRKTTRGKATCVLLCDEIAHWNLAENSKESDKDVLKAAKPALGQFGDLGTLIKLSSPGIKQGVLYEEYKNKRLPDSHINFKAPSWVWNNLLKEKYFKEEFLLDPEGFDSEYRANFVDSISKFISTDYVDKCILKGITFQPPESKYKGMKYYATIDAAFKADRFAFTVAGISPEGRLTQYVINTWEGSKKKPVKAFEVAQYVSAVCKEYKINRVQTDQFAFNPLREIFGKFGVDLEEKTFTNSVKKLIYYNLKNLIHSLNIDLLDDPIQTRELKQLQVEQTNTSLVRIGHPSGGSDDCSDALALAAYLAVAESGKGEFGDTHIVGQNILGATAIRQTVAPSPEFMGQLTGTPVEDNTKDYIWNPDTNRLERVDPDDDDDDGINISM